MKKTILAACLLAMIVGTAHAESNFPFKLAFAPLTSSVQPFRGGGEVHLVYEILLENFENTPLRLQSLTAKGLAGQRVEFQQTLRGEHLKKAFSLIAGDLLKPREPVLQPGQAGILFVFIDLNNKVGPVQEIRHELVAEKLGAPGTAQVFSGAVLPVDSKPVPVLAPPLKGERWWSPNAPANGSVHRRIVVPLHGKIYVPERLAIDWVQIDESGKTYRGPPDKNESYYAHGKPVYSVAAGKVVALKDGIPENTPQAKEMAVPINLETIGGNHLVIEIGGGLYAFYAHLIPGSLKVKLGDTVEPGQVLAALGNTGNSSEPHLHFHLIDNANPLAGQGQPYALSRFTRLKADMKLDAEGDIAQLKITGKEPVEKELLMNLEIVEFD